MKISLVFKLTDYKCGNETIFFPKISKKYKNEVN